MSQSQRDDDDLPQVLKTGGLLQFNSPSRASLDPPPAIQLTGAINPSNYRGPSPSPVMQDLKYELPDLSVFTGLINNPETDIKDLHYQLTRLMGVTSIMLLQEACSKAPSFNRAQTGSRAVEALRALFTTIQEREKNLYKDRLDFDNPRLQFFVDALWDLIEEILRDCGMGDDMVSNFFLLLQSRLPAWEDRTKKVCNAVSFNASKHGSDADRSTDAKLLSSQREKAIPTNKKSKRVPVVVVPLPPTAEDHA